MTTFDTNSINTLIFWSLLWDLYKLFRVVSFIYYLHSQLSADNCFLKLFKLLNPERLELLELEQSFFAVLT